MPNRSKTQCLHPGCNVLVSGGSYCDIHKSKNDMRRGSASSRGYNTTWRKYRIMYLHAHPLCSECLSHGITTMATVVDHIIAHKGNVDLFWDSNNHQSLCKKCHDIKTGTKDRGYW